jgi:hypothetical protein
MSNAERMKYDHQRIEKTLKGLTATMLEELARRGGKRETDKITTDGPRGRGSYSDPTLANVVRKMEGQIYDPVYEAVRTIAISLTDMASLAMRIDDQVRFILDTSERRKRSETAICEACLREVLCTPKDRLKSGYCATHYQAWLRAGKPYRAQFEHEVREKLSAETQEA